MAAYMEITMSKTKVATAVASTVSASVSEVASLAFNATSGGMAAAAMARTLWGADFPTLKPKSVERVEFNTKVLDAWAKAHRDNIPKVVRKMGEYRILAEGEAADPATIQELNPAFVMGFAGNALTKLKRDVPTLGAIVEKQKNYYQNVYADTWRNLCESLARLIKRESGETGRGANGILKPYGERLPKLVDRILTSNTAAFERGDATAYDPAKMDKALDAFSRELKK